MNYATMYKTPKTEAAPSGNKYEYIYEMDIDSNGHKILVKTENMENVYEKIQESLEETKIENIIRRAIGGDPMALAQTNGQYFDATDAPQSLAEAQRMIIQATEDFYKLPLTIREKFDHSPEKYINEFGTESWIGKLDGIINRPPERPAKGSVDNKEAREGMENG